MSADDLTYGVKLTGDGSSLRGELSASRDELGRFKAAAGGSQVETDKLNESTAQMAEQQHRAAASGKSLSEAGGRVAAELAKAASAALAYQYIVVKSIDASNEYTAAIMGLASAARFSGEDIDATLNKAVALTADGLMSTSEAALALKNLLSRGFTADQAIEMINRLKDSAAFGKQASLEFGQAVVSATEGLKNENSILVDNAGVTKNVSVMWKEYAAQIGVTVDSLSQAQKREAEYSGIMRETEGQMGNSALAADSLMGATARMNKATNDAAIAFGQALTPAATLLADGLAWASENAIKPMIFGIQGIGIVAGVATSQVGVMIDFFTSPSKWSTAGIENYRKEMSALGDLGDQMATELAAKLNGAVQTPNIGKDSGARRKDAAPAADTDGMEKLLGEVRKFDEQMVASHDDAFTKTINGWVALQDKMIAAGIYGTKERQAHEAAYTEFIDGESAKREAAADEHTAKLVAKQNEKFATLQQQADAAGMSEAQLVQAKHGRELAELESQRIAIFEATRNDEDLQFQEMSKFEQAKLNMAEFYAQQITEAERRETEQRQKNNLNASQAMIGMASQVAAAASGFLRATGKEHTAMGKIIFAVQKGLAIAQAVINTELAFLSAMALGPAGWAIAPAIRTMGYVSVGLIAATAIAESGGGGAGGGGLSIPSAGSAPSSPGAPATSSTSPPPGQPVQITIYNTGNVQSAEFAAQQVEQIRSLISNSDVILIDPRSRQAAMLAAAK